VEKKVTIKVVSQMFYPDIASTAKVLSDLFFHIDKSYKINVLCQNRSYVLPEVSYDNETHLKNLFIKRIKVKKINKNNIIQRAFNFIELYPKFKKELKKSKDDVFFCVSNPPFLPYLTIKHAKKINKKSVFLLHDLHPDALIKLGKLKKTNLISKLIYYMNSYAFKNSDKIVVLGRDVKNYLLENYGVSEEKIEIITNWGKNNTLLPENNDFRKTHNLLNKFVIMYTGNLGEFAEFDTLLNTAKIMNNDDDIKFVIIGDGRKKRDIEKTINEMQLNNVILLGYQPEDEYYTILNSADALFVSLRKELRGISVPSKTYTYLSVGKPIIAVVPKESEIELSIKEDKYGIYNEYDSYKLKEQITELYKNKDKYKELCENAKTAFSKKYDLKLIVKKYEKLFKELEEPKWKPHSSQE